MKNLLISLVLALVVSCGVSKDPTKYKHDRIPLKKIFIDLAETPYELDRYDCSQKSAEYYWNLVNRGYEAKVILVRAHAFVWVKDWGFYDPTRNQYYFILDSKNPWRDYKKDWRLGYMYGQLIDVIDHTKFGDYLNEFTLENNNGN